MMEMDAKGITWIGNIYNKFENMCLEMEDTLDATYLESQMQIVRENFTRLYSDVMKEILPQSSCDSDETTTTESRIDQDADVGFCKKSSQGFKQITVKENTKLATQDSSINHNFDNDAIYGESCDSDVDIESNLNSDENHQSQKMPSLKTVDEITSAKTNTFSTSQSCGISYDHKVTNSKPSSAVVTTLASVADCCNEIENASVEQTSSVVEFVKSAEEEVMKVVSSSSVVFEDPSGFSIVRRMQPDDCSYNTSAVSHPETCISDMPNINTVIEQGENKTMQQDDELKLEETCVMVTRDELQLVPKERINMKTSKKKRWQPFSLSKKSARKQEYEELAKNGKGDNVESSCQTLLEDQKISLLSELEWELL